MATKARRLRVLVHQGLEEVADSIYAHEIPILVNLHGGIEKLAFVAEEFPTDPETGEPDPTREWPVEPAAEYARLMRRWGRVSGARDGARVAQSLYQSELVFGTFLAGPEPDRLIDQLVRSTQARGRPTDAPEDVLSEAEVSRMLIRLGVDEEDADPAKGLAVLKATLVLRLVEALATSGQTAPVLDSDRSLRDAFALVPMA